MKRMKKEKEENFKKWYLLLGGSIFLLYAIVRTQNQAPSIDMKYLEFEQHLNNGKVKSVTIQALNSKLQLRYIAHVEVLMGQDDRTTTRYIAVSNPDEFIACLPTGVRVELVHSKSFGDFFAENVGIINDLASIAFYAWIAAGVYRFNKAGGMS